MFYQLSLLLIFCFAIGASQWSYVGGTPIISIMFMLLVISPPIFIIFGSIQLTVPIMYAILAGGSLYISIRDVKKVIASTGKYAVDYDLIALSLPVCASGALFGALSKNFLSDLCITLFGTILMIYLLYLTCKQRRELRIQSLGQLMIQQQLLPAAPLQQSKQIQLKQGRNFQLKDKQYQNSRQRNQQQLNPQLQKILDDEANRLPKSKLKIVGFILLYTLAIFLFKNVSTDQLIVIDPQIDIPDGFQDGTEANITDVSVLSSIKSRFESKIRKYSQGTNNQTVDPYINQQGFSSCVVGSFVFILIHVILSYLSSKSVAIQTTTKDSQKQKYGYVFTRQHDKMSSKKMWNCMISGFAGGFVVGLFGIGASIVLIPVWISSGIDQETALNSSTPVTLFASVISLLLFIMTGHDVLVSYSNYLLVIVFVVSLLSTAVVNWLMNRFMEWRSPQKMRNRFKMTLYISSIVGLILYGLPAYVFNSFFSKFGFFC